MKKYLLLIVLALVVLVTAGWVSRPQQTQEVRSRAAAATTLSLRPASLSVATGQAFSFDVLISPASNAVTAIELKLNYPPGLAQLTRIQPNATAFPELLRPADIDNSRGIASIVLGTGTLTPVRSEAVVASLVFSTTATPGIGTVSIAADTKVAALGEAGNVLLSATGATLRSALPTPTPTPTPVPTATPKPTPVPPLRGDLDRDGDVDIYDYNILVTNFGRAGTNVADIDTNGKVDIFDYNILVGNFGKLR